MKCISTTLATFCLTALTALGIVDRDEDGMSDFWEEAHGFSTTDDGTANPSEHPDADPDGDGWSNVRESLAGTDPLTGLPPDGLLLPEMVRHPVTEDVFLITWPTVPGKSYKLFVSPDLTGGSWVQIDDPMTGDGEPIQIAVQASDEGENPCDRLFYRVSVGDIDTDGDNISDAEEIFMGWPPNFFNYDTDSDGISDEGESGSGTNPYDPSSTPSADWFVLTGDLGQGQVKSVQRKYVIPKGESHIFILGITSDEYPEYTGDQSLYDDQISWEITPSGGSPITGSASINEFHTQLEDADFLDIELKDYSPVHRQLAKVLKAPPGDDMTVTVKLTATNVSDGNLPTTLIAAMIPLKIVPDADMAGVLGDMIASNQGPGGEKHFVTPKKSTELPQDHVKPVTRNLDPAWITPGDPNQLVEWVPGVGEAGDDVKRWKVGRDGTPANHGVKIRTLAAFGGEEAAKLNVWTVWASVVPPTTFGSAYISRDPLSGSTIYKSSSGPQFFFKIEPSDLFSATVDRPALEGNRQKDVPGKGKIYFARNDYGDGDTAKWKWDVSRQVQIRRIDSRPPSQNEVTTPFPADLAEGNDDPFFPDPLIDEHADPYSAKSAPFAHPAEHVISFDAPQTPLLNSLGVQGRRIADISNFREFVRLELWDGKRAEGRFWYKVSAYQDWHFTLDFVFGGSPAKWDDNPANPSSVGDLHDNRN